MPFAKLSDLANSLDQEQRHAVEWGLTEEQLALFDLFRKESLSGPERVQFKPKRNFIKLLDGVAQSAAK
ncbi:MAG: hypothetical protein AABY81_06480 [Pseudomonadota bacterium]